MAILTYLEDSFWQDVGEKAHFPLSTSTMAYDTFQDTSTLKFSKILIKHWMWFVVVCFIVVGKCCDKQSDIFLENIFWKILQGFKAQLFTL